MNIGLVVPTLRGYGGLEKYMVDLLLALTGRYSVTLVSQHYVNPDTLFRAFGSQLPLDKIHFCIDAACAGPGPGSRLRRLGQARDFARLTSPFDLLFMSTWLTPPAQSARRGVLICHFPGQGRVHKVHNLFSAAFREQKDLSTRINSWNTMVTSSLFGRNWIQEYWHRNSSVLYPGVVLPEAAPTSEKSPWILGCGFFSQPAEGETYSYKRQEILLEGFRRLCEQQPGLGVELHLAGHVSQDQQGRDIMARLERLSQGLPVVFHANCSGQELLGLYRRSSIFWHATGYAIDEKLEPFRLEHFGMVTVEAMSAGCVPVVYGQGGQREIVEDGQSGHWWFQLDQLVECTAGLLANPARLAQMGQAARLRAGYFSSAQFTRRTLELTEAELSQL